VYKYNIISCFAYYLFDKAIDQNEFSFINSNSFMFFYTARVLKVNNLIKFIYLRRLNCEPNGYPFSSGTV